MIESFSITYWSPSGSRGILLISSSSLPEHEYNKTMIDINESKDFDKLFI